MAYCYWANGEEVLFDLEKDPDELRNIADGANSRFIAISDLLGCSYPMPKPTKPPLRAKRPRAEVQEEFSEIREEVESAKKTAEPKREESLRQQEADLRAAVGGLSVEGVVQQMSGLSLEISKALGWALR